MDEQIGFVVGSVVALCSYVVLNILVKTRNEKKRDPKSKMKTS